MRLAGFSALTHHILGLIAAVLLSIGPAAAQVPFDVTQHFVYIVCTSSTNSSTRGSGVIIGTDDGGVAVLTAEHVAPAGKGYACKGLVGKADEEPTRVMEERQRFQYLGYDAMILSLHPNPEERDRVGVGYLPLRASLKTKRIHAYGVAPRPGPILPVGGEIVTTTPMATTKSKGVILHGAITTSAMSGGPLILDENGGLVGIVLGGVSDQSTGLPGNYMMLAVAELKPFLTYLKELPSTAQRPSAPVTDPCHETFPRYTYPYGDRDHLVATLTCKKGMTPGSPFAVKIRIERFCTNSSSHAPVGELQLMTNNLELRTSPIRADSGRCNSETIVIEHRGVANGAGLATADVRLRNCLTRPPVPPGAESGVRCVLERGDWWMWPEPRQ